jgi:hypothetical protein
MLAISTTGLCFSIGLPLLAVAVILILFRIQKRPDTFRIEEVDLSGIQMTGYGALDFKNYAVAYFRKDKKLLEFTNVKDGKLLAYMEKTIYPKLTTSFHQQTNQGTGEIEIRHVAIEVMQTLAELGIEPFASGMMRSW